MADRSFETLRRQVADAEGVLPKSISYFADRSEMESFLDDSDSRSRLIRVWRQRYKAYQAYQAEQRRVQRDKQREAVST